MDDGFVVSDMVGSEWLGEGMPNSLKAREARLRRVAAQQGLAIIKSRRRGAKAGYTIVDPQTEAVVCEGASDDDGLTIDKAEAILGKPQSTKSISVANLNAANDE